MTFTCNQAEHFGISVIKKWIDGNEWKEHFPSYYVYNEDEQKEIYYGLQQAASGLLLRNWMEVRILFIRYLCESSSSPFAPVECIFSRDEYHSDVGNLPHMHMMLCIDKTGMSEEVIHRLHELVRASIANIVRLDEVQGLVDEGIFERFEDVYELQDLADIILPHRCAPRCLMRIES